MPRRANPTQLEHPHHPAPVASEWFEHLEHVVIVTDLAGEGEGHDARNVEIADRNGIGVTAGDRRCEPGSPRPDTGQTLHPRDRFGSGNPVEPFESIGVLRCDAQHPSPASFDPYPVKIVVLQCEQCGRIGEYSYRPTERRIAVIPSQAFATLGGIGSDDPLPDRRRDGRLVPSPGRPDPEAPNSVGNPSKHRMFRSELIDGFISEPDQCR